MALYVRDSSPRRIAVAGLYFTKLLVGRYGPLLVLALIRLDMHVAVCVNLTSLFVVINRVSP